MPHLGRINKRKVRQIDCMLQWLAREKHDLLRLDSSRPREVYAYVHVQLEVSPHEIGGMFSLSRSDPLRRGLPT
jgi:hypothetical protein